MTYTEKDDKRLTPLPHSLTLSDRQRLTLTGVVDIISCDSEIITIRTNLGELTINGIKLNMGSFNRETGDLEIVGSIKELVYSDIDIQKRSFFSRLMR